MIQENKKDFHWPVVLCNLFLIAILYFVALIGFQRIEPLMVNIGGFFAIPILAAVPTCVAYLISRKKQLFPVKKFMIYCSWVVLVLMIIGWYSEQNKFSISEVREDYVSKIKTPSKIDSNTTLVSARNFSDRFLIFESYAYLSLRYESNRTLDKELAQNLTSSLEMTQEKIWSRTICNDNSFPFSGVTINYNFGNQGSIYILLKKDPYKTCPNASSFNTFGISTNVVDSQESTTSTNSDSFLSKIDEYIKVESAGLPRKINAITDFTSLSRRGQTLAYSYVVNSEVELGLLKSQQEIIEQGLKTLYKNDICPKISTNEELSAVFQLENHEYNFQYLNHNFKVILKKPYCKG